MATPTFRCLRDCLPTRRIILVIRERLAPVLRGAKWFDRRILLSGRTGRVLRCTAELRRERCELGLVLPGSFRSALMLRVAGVRRRVGHSRDARGLLLTDPLPRPSANGRFRPTYMVDYYLALCEALGMEPRSRRTELPFDARDMAVAKTALVEAEVDLERPLFLLHPGAAFGPAKLWPAERFAALAENLADNFDAQVACIGAPADSTLIRAIADGSRAPLTDLSARGIDLHLLKCVVKLSRLLVTTDSGPRHYGVALEVPTVCLMGPTHPDYSTSGLPWDHVVRADVPCGPCQKKTCKLDHRCMNELTVEMALAACRDALEGGHPA